MKQLLLFASVVALSGQTCLYAADQLDLAQCARIRQRVLFECFQGTSKHFEGEMTPSRLLTIAEGLGGAADLVDVVLALNKVPCLVELAEILHEHNAQACYEFEQKHAVSIRLLESAAKKGTSQELAYQLLSLAFYISSRELRALPFHKQALTEAFANVFPGKAKLSKSEKEKFKNLCARMLIDESTLAYPIGFADRV